MLQFRFVGKPVERVLVYYVDLRTREPVSMFMSICDPQMSSVMSGMNALASDERIMLT